LIPDVPQIESSSEKEAYAFFGLAAYFAQVLERSALNFALILQLPEVNLVTREIYDSGYEALERRTFGQLLRACEKEFDISNETKRILDEALKLRNELIHEFFFERAEDFVSEKGRLKMMEELKGIIGKFQIADNLLESIYLPIFDKYGITEKYLAAEFNAMTRRARDRDDSS
jgi:hypothetical protein